MINSGTQKHSFGWDLASFWAFLKMGLWEISILWPYGFCFGGLFGTYKFLNDGRPPIRIGAGV